MDKFHRNTHTHSYTARDFEISFKIELLRKSLDYNNISIAIQFKRKKRPNFN